MEIPPAVSADMSHYANATALVNAWRMLQQAADQVGWQRFPVGRAPTGRWRLTYRGDTSRGRRVRWM